MTTGTGPQRGYPIENTSEEDIPPRSIVLVTGVTYAEDKQKSWSTVTKYNGDPGNIMVTGPVTIPAQMMNADDALVNGRGVAYYDDFIYVSVDPALTAMTAGDELGPVADEWFIGSAGSGFVAQGDLLPDSDPPRAQFYRSGGGGGGATQGRLLSAISPASNGLTGATTFTFARYVRDPDIDPQTDPVTMKEEDDGADPPEAVETEGVNRAHITGAIDDHVVCVRISGEWVPVLVAGTC